MNFYIDITLLPSDDIGHHFLWEKVFQQVHLALVEIKDANGQSPVGISFPEFSDGKKRVGRKFRLLALDETTLIKLDIDRWLDRLLDYVHIKKVQTVPEGIDQHIRFQRLQTKSSVDRLARRAAKRQLISYEQALEERKMFDSNKTDAPFIWMKSLGSDNRFRLFLRSEIVSIEDAQEGGFSTYGLSNGGSLPHF